MAYRTPKIFFCRVAALVIVLGGTLCPVAVSYAAENVEPRPAPSDTKSESRPSATLGTPAGTSDTLRGADQFQLSNILPPSVAQDLDLYAWGWFGYTHNSQRDGNSFSDVDLAIGATERIQERLAVSVDMHFLDAADHPRGSLEQAFVTAELSEQDGHPGTLLTVGKFNARFGAEPRDPWDRLTGTPSLLFAAQPQDLLGVMLTQSVGQTGITLRPFVVSSFEGRSDLTGPPSAGLVIEYKPTRVLTFSITNFFGPGFNRPESEYYPAAGGANEYSNHGSGYTYPSYSPSEYASPSAGSYKYDYTDRSWLGPNLEATRGGSLYFVDAALTWMPRSDLTLSAEGLLAATGASAGHFAWGGALVLGNFDITDRLRVFGRWSFLDDPQGLITGEAQRRHELSGGFGFLITRGVEFRAEYRHDFSAAAGDVDSVSAHLTFSF
jgi:hypothetical protein